MNTLPFLRALIFTPNQTLPFSFRSFGRLVFVFGLRKLRFGQKKCVLYKFGNAWTLCGCDGATNSRQL